MNYFRNKTYVSIACQTDEQLTNGQNFPLVTKGSFYKDEIFPEHESVNTEFKASMSKICLQNSIKTVIAFANKDGGTIYYGIRDDRKILGINTKSLDEVQRTLFDSIRVSVYSASILNYRVFFYQVGFNDYIVCLKVEKSLCEVSDKNGNVYHRIGTSSCLKYSITDIKDKEEMERKLVSKSSECETLKRNIAELKKYKIQYEKIKELINLKI